MLYKFRLELRKFHGYKNYIMQKSFYFSERLKSMFFLQKDFSMYNFILECFVFVPGT
jgi:hypothetical protein